jgi:hypothetical protein
MFDKFCTSADEVRPLCFILFPVLNCGAAYCDNAYYFSFVSSDCDSGEYGAGCKQKCGRCTNMSDCNRYTGECPHGCEPGYYPPFCQESEFFTL